MSLKIRLVRDSRDLRLGVCNSGLFRPGAAAAAPYDVAVHTAQGPQYSPRQLEGGPAPECRDAGGWGEGTSTRCRSARASAGQGGLRPRRLGPSRDWQHERGCAGAPGLSMAAVRYQGP